MDDDRVNRTVVLPLVVPPERVADLHATRRRVAYCQRRTSDVCWDDPNRPADVISTYRTAETALYHQLREETEGLHSNLVQKAMKDVTSNMGTAKSNWRAGDQVGQPTYPDSQDDGSYAITYDKRAATFHKYEVSLATVTGRVECRYVLPRDIQGTPYERYVLDSRWSFGTSKLVFDGERFWLHAVCTRPRPTQPVWATDAVDESSSDTQTRIRLLGVDCNVDGHSVVTSVAGFHGNADALNDRREQFERVRGGLQQTGTRSAHRTFYGMSGREWRFFDAYAHDCANGIVDDALGARCTHVVFEDLTRIRKRISNAPKFQQWLFKRIRTYTADKLELLGIKTATVNPRNTSKRCSHTDCESCTDANRSGSRFECVDCGLALHADYNAARNIALQWFAENAHEMKHGQSSQTCSAGRATSQLALKSGTLSPDGVFSPVDGLSTDKPTSSLVGR
ncbi:RNA-guided endonuclease InsQ/TnpB family protein [Halomarina rubra]|uniref:RNA-guided endonuclease InsQ/TnpB family protein n=1 Tax=Halomarina rubra TaxID=2071873 RepID=A0ABD6AX20_9EURY|nr:RNA-guided endonuclease TnpB family protein [Halomarina rubra]